MGMTFTADSTGQSGVAFGDVPNFVVNKGLVENGANGTPTGTTCICNGNPGRGKYGRDCFLKSNGNEVTSFISRYLEWKIQIILIINLNNLFILVLS
jgi:hypothetical protein